MTVTQIVEEARNNLNALTDTLWSDSELYLKLYRVMLKVAKKTKCIDTTDSSASTVAGTATYTVPTALCELWRLTYDGSKLQYADRREMDTINPSGTTTSGTPSYYTLEGTTVTLFPTPSAVATLKYFYYAIPSAVPTAATTLEIPARYHDVLVSGLTHEMCPKDLGHPLTLYWNDKFKSELAEMEAHCRSKKRGDRMANVKVEENMLNSEFGVI